MASSHPHRCITTPAAVPVRCSATASSSSSSGEYDYDLFTIGAGSGGVRGSRFASGYGAKVAVAELPFEWISSDTAGGVGGTCVLRGCVPKKLMVYASQYAEEFRDSTGFGWVVLVLWCCGAVLWCWLCACACRQGVGELAGVGAWVRGGAKHMAVLAN